MIMKIQATSIIVGIAQILSDVSDPSNWNAAILAIAMIILWKPGLMALSTPNVDS